MSKLACFIESEYNTENKEDVFLKHASGIYFNDLFHILNNIYITRNASIISIPKVLATKLRECYHHEGIQLILQYLIENKIENTLTIGCTGMSSNDVYYKGINSSLSFLNSKPFELIKTAIGVNNFLDLILNTSAIWKPSNIIIWGNYKCLPFNESKHKRKTVSVRSMLYKSMTSENIKQPVPESPLKLLELIFDDVSSAKWKKNPIKRYRKVYRNLRTVTINYETLKHRFAYIVDNICKVQTSSLDVKRHQIIKLVHTVVYKTIPLELFGTEFNRTKIMRYVPKLINGTISDHTDTHLIMQGIKLTDIEWVKPVSNLKMTKHEFLRAQNMFSSFIIWLFNSFICKFLGCYFHITNISQTERLCFYRHHIWRKITKRYMSKYFSKHIINKPDKVNSFLSFSKNIDYIGRLSLHPKKETFRLIVKPFKGRFDEKIQFLTYQKRIVRPMNSILNKIRNNNDCASVIDIVEKIYRFKAHLLKSYDKLPQIYALKFDAKDAYDSLPHELIDNIVKERLDSFTENDVIYVQLLQQIDSGGIMKGRKLVVSDSIKNLQFYSEGVIEIPRVSADLHETFCFSKDQIMSYVRSQYRQTCFHTKCRSYFRKVGVFQGFPLSGTLFNLVYDYLVSELYELIDNDSETIIIRLVDDFLVLSTSKSVIGKFRRLIARRLPKYNFSANRQKTAVSKDLISFTGISIDVQKLICYKHLQNYNNSPIHVSSFSTLYKQLTNYGKMWIRKTCLFNPNNTASGTVGAHINFVALLKSLVYKFTNSYRMIRMKKSFHFKDFAKFLDKLILEFSNLICYKEIGFDSKKFWRMTMKILYHKNVLRKKKKIKLSP